LDGEALIVQSADGLKVRMMLQNPLVCVEIEHIDNPIEAESRVRSGNGHTPIYRIHLLEKTGRFERR
jgi:nitroimidazol reductase NimA-like FMN-containing flavoprotein (pyridoxamine 5'-phosphate oxidase superfamily)